MKILFFFVLFLSIGSSVFAQQKSAADSTTLQGFPVLRSYVAPDVVERAKKKYGRPLYCMEKTLAPNCENSYLVGLIKNGKLTIEFMCDDPKMVLQTTGSSLTIARLSH